MTSNVGRPYHGDKPLCIFKEDARHDDITVQVGRCFCDFGSLTHGYLAIRVASRADANDDSSGPHMQDHHTHVGRSSHWMLHSGVASREFCDINERLTLRVTFTRDRASTVETSYVMAFEIGDGHSGQPSSPADPLRSVQRADSAPPSPSVSVDPVIEWCPHSHCPIIT